MNKKEMDLTTGKRGLFTLISMLLIITLDGCVSGIMQPVKHKQLNTNAKNNRLTKF